MGDVREKAQDLSTKISNEIPQIASTEEVSGNITQHRGRLQVQGKDLKVLSEELSWAWTQQTPPTAQQALAELENMKAQLSKTALEERKQAFPDAAEYIAVASRNGGIFAPFSKSFQDRNRFVASARVDIEIRTGKAFI